MAYGSRGLPGSAIERALARSGLGAGSIGVALLGACTAFEPGSDELTSPDVAVQSLEPGHDWGCLPDAIATPAPYFSAPADARRVVQSVQILNIVTQAVIPGISVRACSQRDIQCAEPVTATLAVGTDGWVDMPLYEGFAGYLEITGETLVPTALFYPDPVRAGQEVYATAVGLVERSSLPALTTALGNEQSLDQGLVVLRALDCQGQEAIGVRYSLDRPGVPWYFVGGLPSGSAVATTDSGVGGFLNVSPGISVVRAELETTGQAIVAPTTILVRPGWMTAMRFVPPVP